MILMYFLTQPKEKPMYLKMDEIVPNDLAHGDF